MLFVGIILRGAVVMTEKGVLFLSVCGRDRQKERKCVCVCVFKFLFSVCMHVCARVHVLQEKCGSWLVEQVHTARK